MSENFEQIRLGLKNVRAQLMQKANVVATGIGYKTTNGENSGEIALICSVTHKVDKKHLSEHDTIPSTVMDIPTDVKTVGVIRALQDPRRKHRPAPGGVSVGHERITAGTLGCWVKKNDKYHILSNNHVLANSNEAIAGDSILQPGPYDSGEWPLDRIAKLTDFVPIKFETGQSDCKIGTKVANFLNSISRSFNRQTRMKLIRENDSAENLVDAAIAKPLDQDDVKDEILEIGKIQGMAEGELGMVVQKYGRTTGYTKSSIEQIDVSVKVDYGAGKSALFVNQLIAGEMSQGGDSGSAVLNMNNELVGLLFAGSDTITVFNRIQDVTSTLDISI